MKIAINRCFGGFSLSPQGAKRFAELKGKPCFFFVPDPHKKESLDFVLTDDPGSAPFFIASTSPSLSLSSNGELDILRPENRSDPHLIQVIEELGDEADGRCADLEIVEIPDDVDYTIEEYDGSEHVAEVHRTWP